MKLVVGELDQGRLDGWLAAQMPEVSRSQIQAWIREGRVVSEVALLKPSMKVVPGQVIEVRVPVVAASSLEAEALPLDIIYEDAELAVVNKPAGLVVHPAAGNPAGTLVNALLHRYPELLAWSADERPGIVHRLDKDTSGLMVVARTPAMQLALIELFKVHAVHKEYLALVHGQPPALQGTLRGMMGRHPVRRQQMALDVAHGKEAITHYRVEGAPGHGCTLLRCQIETGRTHQIRVHVRSMGTPLVGDPVYGRRTADRRLPQMPPRQMLHAAELAFTHPQDGRALAFKVPMPPDFSDLLASLAE